MEGSPPGSSVHGILQARIPEWFTISSFRGSFRPRDWTHVLGSPALQAEPLPLAPAGEAPWLWEMLAQNAWRLSLWNWDAGPSHPSTPDTAAHRDSKAGSITASIFYKVIFRNVDSFFYHNTWQWRKKTHQFPRWKRNFPSVSDKSKSRFFCK